MSTLLTTCRDLIGDEPSTEVFADIVNLLSRGWERGDAEVEMATAYAIDHMRGWPAGVKRPLSVVPRCDTSDTAFLKLVGLVNAVVVNALDQELAEVLYTLDLDIRHIALDLPHWPRQIRKGRGGLWRDAKGMLEFVSRLLTQKAPVESLRLAYLQNHVPGKELPDDHVFSHVRALVKRAQRAKVVDLRYCVSPNRHGHTWSGGLPELVAPTELYLQSCGIRANDLIDWPLLDGPPTLKVLDLRYNALWRGKGVQRLATAPGLSQLEVLYLNTDDIGRDGARVLANSETLPAGIRGYWRRL